MPNIEGLTIQKVETVFSPYWTLLSIGLHKTKITYKHKGIAGNRGLPSLEAMALMASAKVISTTDDNTRIIILPGKLCIGTDDILLLIDYEEYQFRRRWLDTQEMKELIS